MSFGDSMLSISLTISVLMIIGFIIYRFYQIQINKKLQKDTKKNQNTTEITLKDRISGLTEENFVKLNQLRNYRYDIVDTNGAILSKCYIDNNMFEGFGMFLTIGNDIVSFYLKLLHFVLNLHDEIKSGSIDKEKMKEKLDLYNECMNYLLDTTDNFDERMMEIYKNSNSDFNIYNLQEVPDEVISEYCKMVRDMITSVSEYLQICAIIDEIMKDDFSEFIEEFSNVRKTFLEVFFVEIFNCINMLDKSIYTKKPTDWKGDLLNG